MQSNDNMQLHQNIVGNSEIKNKGFFTLYSLFKENGWHMTKNEMNWIFFTKKGFETEYFEIKIDISKIYVSIPIKNSIFQYSTSFKDYYSAVEYIEERFTDFIF
jgi:hypothetical protein